MTDAIGSSTVVSTPQRQDPPAPRREEEVNTNPTDDSPRVEAQQETDNTQAAAVRPEQQPVERAEPDTDERVGTNVDTVV